VSRDERTDPLAHQQRRARRPTGAAPLRRSAHDRRLGGVAGGVAAFVGANPRWVRALFVLVAVLSLGIGVPVYLALWWLLPVAKS